MAKLIGWREWASLPKLGVDRVKVKVDTGARTSALHAYRLEFTEAKGKEWVTCYLHPLQKNTQLEVICKAPVKERRVVKDSGGHEETRVVIDTKIEIGGERWSIELTLTDRENMGFRMLLGRRAIKGRFYVDPTQSFLLTQRETDDSSDQEE